jgi:sugar phosphate permease
MAPLLSYIILDFGWRIGAIFAGLIILIVTLPSAIFIKQSPESMGLHPDGQPFLKDSIQQLNPSRQEVFEVTYTVREALKALQFWLLTAGISLRLLVTIALNTHFVPLLVWKGMSEATSAYMVGAAAFGGIFTSLVLGWLGDRWNKTLLSSLCIVPMILSMVGLIFSKENAVLYLFPISFAITMGTSPLNWALIGDFFGRGSYATIRGIMGVAYGTATFISPIYAGWIFDRTGSYNLVLITFSIILGMSAMFFAVLGRPSPPKQKNKSLALL